MHISELLRDRVSLSTIFLTEAPQRARVSRPSPRASARVDKAEAHCRLARAASCLAARSSSSTIAWLSPILATWTATRARGDPI